MPRIALRANDFASFPQESAKDAERREGMGDPGMDHRIGFDPRVARIECDARVRPEPTHESPWRSFAVFAPFA